MPRRSGYGPAVSDGVATHVPEPAPPPLVDPEDASVVGLVGDDEPQPAVIAAPTAAILPSTARRLKALECGMRGPMCKAGTCRIRAYRP